MKFGVIQFPGSNCDQDVFHVLKHVLGQETVYLWHKDESLQGADAVIVPGGFSYGDYLRCGAIARFSPVMRSVVAHAAAGGPVMGICNGFQILCESGLLPGALIRNKGLHFVCRHVHIRSETPQTPFTCQIRTGAALKIPVAHGEGCYFADDATLARIEKNGQVVFRYCDAYGRLDGDATGACGSINPNGSRNNIAGICNEKRNVLGMMPHPERAAERELGSTDGLALFEGLAHTLALKGCLQ